MAFAGVSVTVPSAAVTPVRTAPSSPVRVTVTPPIPGSSAGVHVPLWSTARTTRTVTEPSAVAGEAEGAATAVAAAKAATTAAARSARRRAAPGTGALVC
ncbi:hypothetical protein Kpho01_17380 [Kitasatospora phosalacinea]|uniref:Uncharacterized protein n=1 Tax=Kitasatospora phosalacinea TaxID=2065 RepID=A0A9W6UN34_9ACTN|nr:hypothetical protein Kpho01_17380 [Kitasatospora phosalacinea]